MKNFILVLLALSLTACAHSRQKEVNRVLAQYKATLDPMIGSDEDSIVETLGAPKKVSEIGSYKIFHYYQHYGTQSDYREARNLYTGESLGQGYSNSWESYDKCDIYFKGGKMVKYESYVQR